MRGYKQLAPLVADDDAIDIDQLVRDAASGVQADARARRTDTPDLTGGDDDLPYIPLDLDESEYTFQAPRIEPREFPARGEPYGTPAPSLGGFAPRTAPGFQSDGRMSVRGTARFGEHLRRTAEQALRNQPPASPSAPLASPPPAAQTAPGTTPQPPETQVAPQAQQAPAVAPHGQGGQPPAQDAAEEAPLSSVPTEGGNMRPEAAPMLTPMADRARKFAEAPGAFKPTGDEEARLADAQRLDDQGARRQRIARGILSGLGLLGAATGLNGLAGIGAAGLGATNAASRAPNERTNRVREEIARRMQGMQAEREAANQAATREAQGIESQRQAARQSRLDDANIALTEARTEAAQAEQAQTQMEAEIERGNINGARGIFRSFVGSLNSDAEAAQMARQFIASPDFANATADDLRNYGSRLAMLANNRHSGLLTRGGGGHGQTVSAYDPTTGGFVDRRVGGGQRREAPTLPPTYEELQALQAAQPPMEAPAPAPVATPAPRRGGGGGGAPRAAAAPAASPASTPATGNQVPLPTEDESLLMAVRARGIDPNTTEGLAYAASLRRALQSSDEPTARAADAEIRSALAESAQDDGIPPGVPRDEWRQRVTQAEDHANSFNALRPLLRTLHSASPAQITAALHGGAAMARVAGASALRRRIFGYYNSYYHHFGGANITPSEAERYQNAFGADSIAVDPRQFTAAMEEAQRLNARQAQTIIQSISRRGPEAWEHYRRTVLGIGGRR